MAKRKSTKKKTTAKRRTPTSLKTAQRESDSAYFLKIVVFMILGSMWFYIESYPDWQIPIPVGLVIGLVFATHEHFQIDRKIEYVVLLISSFVAFWLPIGLIIQV